MMTLAIKLFEHANRLERGAELTTVIGIHSHQRHPIFFADQSLHRQRSFDRNGVGFNEQILEEWIIFFVQLQRGFRIALEKCVHHFGELARDEVAGNADDALRAGGHKGQCEGVITAENCKLFW